MANTVEVASSDVERLFELLDDNYCLTYDLHGNGCEHGFKPAKKCPNADCTDAELHRLIGKIKALVDA